jgi:MoaA/NifB/PqqE/SkfB family radical SAM enzyme
VSIDTTSLCNLRCTMCALERDYPEKALMSLDTFRRLEDSFPRLRHVSLSLNAEPLLNKRLAEMVALAKHASRGRIVTSFATNATLLDEARARELLEAGLDALEVSLDGTTAPVFESIRVGARLEPVVANVARVARLKRALGLATPHVSLRYTLSRDNLADLASLLDLALRLEVDHLVVNGVEPYDEATAAKVLYGREADPRVEALFTELEQRAQEHGVRLDLPRLVPETIGDCRLTDHACVILVDGTVAPCSPLSYPRDFFFLGERAHHPRVAFGNVRERPLHEIWESPEYVAFRERLRSGELIDACRTCLKRAGVIRPLKHWKWLGAQRRAVAVQPRS